MKSFESWTNWIFFLLAGMVSLLLFNTILNFSEFFDAVREDSVFYMTSANCLGGVISFLLSSLIAPQASKAKKVYLLACISAGLTITIFGFALSGPQGKLGLIVLTGLSFFGGITNSWYQSILISIAAEISPCSIRNFNFGSGVIGVLITFVCFVLNKLLPTRNYSGQLVLDVFHPQIFFYAIFYFLSFGAFFATFTAWLRSGPKYVDIPAAQGKAEVAKVDSSTKFIFMRSCDINLGMFVNYTATLNVAGFWIYTSFKTFNTDGGVSLPLFFLMFNLGDMVSKAAPVSILPRSSDAVHALNGLKLLSNVYFFITVINHPEGFVVSSLTRLVIILVVGLMNGYLTNAYMVINGDRFTSPAQRGTAGYNNVFFLLSGLAAGSFVSLLI